MTMRLPFTKYQGTGNDFVLVDAIGQTGTSINPDIIPKICDRRFGVGADGLIILKPHQTADFYMDYYNADGSQSFCGNGSRCAVHMAHALKYVGNECVFETIDGLHAGRIDGALVEIKLQDVGPEKELEMGYFINTGSPHLVCLVKDPDKINVEKLGREYRDLPQFAPDGTNVNFLSVSNQNAIRIRTYERGVEAETLSCGSGVAAASIIATRHGLSSPVTIHTLGGTLLVSFKVKAAGGYSEVYLKGPATKVFQGEMDL